MRASCSSRVRFDVRITSGRARGPDRPDLGDRDLEVGEQLQQERLELVVGAVDLVDQQHRRLWVVVLDGVQQRPALEELPAEQLVQALLAAAGLGGLERADIEQLARVAPVVERVGDVDALVALQPDQAAAGDVGEHLRQLGLADARLALQQQRLLEHQRQVQHGGQPAIGQVGVFAERVGQRIDGVRRHGSTIPGRFRATRSPSRVRHARVTQHLRLAPVWHSWQAVQPVRSPYADPDPAIFCHNPRSTTPGPRDAGGMAVTPT